MPRGTGALELPTNPFQPTLRLEWRRRRRGQSLEPLVITQDDRGPRICPRGVVAHLVQPLGGLGERGRRLTFP